MKCGLLHGAFDESFRVFLKVPGVTKRFHPAGGGIDPGTLGTLSERATFTTIFFEFYNN